MDLTSPWLLGVEIGGTKLQVALARSPDRIEWTERRAADRERGAAGILDQIAESTNLLLDRSDLTRADVGAIGIGFGGPVDAATGRVVRSHQVGGWDGFSIVDWARDELGCPLVALGNDSDLAALAEALFGAGEGRSPILYVNSGSGVGGGLVVDAQVYTGGSGVGAVEVGHLRIDALPENAPPTPAPTLEDLASGWAIGRRAAGPHEEPLPVPEVASRAAAGDVLAREALQVAALAMGRGLAHAVTLLAPRRVILGGGVSLLPDAIWMNPICEELDRRVFPPFRGTFDVVTARLGERVVLHGALALARHAS